jgi:rod shape-determining protein MreC
MRNLFLFIWKHNFFFLFFLLETISIYFLVSHNYFHRATFINSANNVSGSINEPYSNVNDYFNLREANKALAEENARLHSCNKEAFDSYSKSTTTVNDTVYRQKYLYRSAKVVSNSVSNQKNYITLNIGSKQGVKKNMAVVSPQGVVGIVEEVSENFSSVMSVLHIDAKISSKVKKDGSFGPLFWEGGDARYVTLTDIPTHVKLTKGDTIVTSAYSTIFPEGIMIGTVEDAVVKSGQYFFTIKVKLSTPFKSLNHVYVIENILKDEQETLENLTKKNDQ